MFKKFHLITIVVAFCCVVVFLGCPSGSGGGGGGGGTLHTYADASPEMTALGNGLAAAAGSTNPSSSAYYTYSNPIFTYYFNNYVSNGITLNGNLAINMSSPETEIGTINCSGGTVSQVIYNVSISGAVYSGTYTIKFTDNTSWIYDFGTNTFTGI